MNDLIVLYCDFISIIVLCMQRLLSNTLPDDLLLSAINYLIIIAVNMKNPFLPDMSDVLLLMSDVLAKNVGQIVRHIVRSQALTNPVSVDRVGVNIVTKAAGNPFFSTTFFLG